MTVDLSGSHTVPPFVAWPPDAVARPRVTDSSQSSRCPPGGGRREIAFPRPATASNRLLPSLLSCVLLRPAPPVTRTRPLDCLAQVTSSLRWSYLEHSHQSAAFQTPVDARHRIPLRPPHSLHGYSCPSPQQSRQWDAIASAFTTYVQGSRPGIVSSGPGPLISGNRIQKRSLTHPGGT
jgi:hypothetical protein